MASDIEVYSGHDFGEKMSFTVGISYMTASIIGFWKGAFEGRPKDFSMPKKLLLNNFFNSVGKRTSTFGQAAASASLMYYFMASGLNLLFEDELANFNQTTKNIICGALTGGLYKSTLGIVPMFVGSVVGGTLIGSLTLLVDQLNEKGYVAFEMKF